jgi:TIR domain-containing protein
MRVFLSYATEDRAVAEQTYEALRADRHQVFFDRTELVAGDSYHLRIRDEIARSKIFVFFISSNSLRSGSYAQTELGLAAENPSRRRTLIPVRLEDIPFDSLPSALSEITFLDPRGDTPAEVVAAVHAVQRRDNRIRVVRAIGLTLMVAAGLLSAGLLRQRLQLKRGSEMVKLVSSPQPGGWAMVPSIAEPVVRQILYRIDGNGPFQSTGDSPYWFKNEFKIPLYFFTIAGPSRRHRIEIQ